MYNLKDQYKFKQDVKYAYAVGVIKILETRLLTQTDLQRLLETSSPEEALEFLRDSPYEESLSELESIWNFDVALNNELERTYQQIDELSLDKKLTELFRVKWDFYNLKVLLKQSYLEEAEEFSFISNLCLTAPENIKTAIEESDEERSIIDDFFGPKDGVPEYLREAMFEAKEVYDAENDPQLIDVVIDRHTQEYLYRHSEKCPFLAHYFKKKIDLANIRNFIRVRLHQNNLELLQKALLDDGTVEKQVFIDEFNEDVSHLPEVLSSTPYFEIVDEGLREWSETDSLTTLERLSEDYLIEFLRPAKYQAFGVEPLIAYLLAKESEVKQVRIIIVGKLNRLPEDAILGRLRVAYV